MNTKRIFTWGGLIIVLGLIVWGMIAASQKADKENANVPPADKETAEDWVSGATTTPVTLIEYSDFQCPACKAYYPVIEKMLKENPTLVHLVYRHFPLPQHANAVPAALASEAAGKQGKFWEMYHILFENQETWAESKDAKTIFAGYAEKIGVNMEQYNTDVISKEVNDKVTEDMKSGQKAKIDHTPSIYINGKIMANPQSYDEFKKTIEAAAKSNS